MARALFQDDKLDEAKGGLIIKDDNKFDYALHDQPEGEGEPFLGVVSLS